MIAFRRPGTPLQEATEITIEDSEALRRAVKSLEHPSLAGRLTNLVGKPVQLIGYALPSFASKAIASATSKGSKRRSRSPPRFIGSLDPEKTERRRFAIEDDGLELANRLHLRMARQEQRHKLPQLPANLTPGHRLAIRQEDNACGFEPGYPGQVCCGRRP